MKISIMNVDLNVKDLVPYLPHRPPMVWISKILEVGKDYKGLTGRCLVEVDSNALYVNNRTEIRGSSAIEFTAQSFGYLKAAYQLIHKITDVPSKTYLTGVRSCQANFTNYEITEGAKLEVQISVLREMLPVTYIKGEIFCGKSLKKYANVEIQVYVE